MEGKRTELAEKIYCDVQTEIRNYYDSLGIKYKSNEEPEDTIIDFLSYLYRLIPVTKRKVHYSKELSKKIDLKEVDEKQAEILKKYSDAFSEGKNMNAFLSNNIKDSKKPDFLFIHGIYIIYSNFAHRFYLCTLKIQYLAVIQLSKVCCYAA